MKIKPTNLSEGLSLGDEGKETPGMSLRMLLSFIELETCLKGGISSLSGFCYCFFYLFGFLFYV